MTNQQLEELRGVHTWDELADACRRILEHGEEGTAELWGSSLMSTAASVFSFLARGRAPEGDATR
jgi:hypothetical protein